jgi:hypothetical protein
MASERNGGERAENGGGPPLEMPEIRFTQLFIDGRFVDAVSGTSHACLISSLSRSCPCTTLRFHSTIDRSSMVCTLQ